MSQLLPSFDPTQTTSGKIQTNMGTNPGKLVAANHSGVTLILTFADGQQKKLWANTARLFPVTIATPTIPWQQDAILVVQGGYNRVDLELYGLDEDIVETYPIALTAPPQAAPASFVIIGNQLTPASNTFINIGATTINIGNFPFANNEINAGIATAGIIFFQISSCTLSFDPITRDGTTVQGAAVGIRLIVVDSGGANVCSFPFAFDGRFFFAEITSRGGGDQAPAALVTPTPIYVQCNVTAGAGPPYSVQAQVVGDDPYPSTGINVLISVAFGITAAPPPALT